MDFKESRPIYLQIADKICGEILTGKFAENERIPSVREYASGLEVNANTVVRSYDFLQNKDIIFNKRGIGYFVAEGAAFSTLFTGSDNHAQKIYLNAGMRPVRQFSIMSIDL